MQEGDDNGPMTDPRVPTGRRPTLPRAETLEAAAQDAFAQSVGVYDEQDTIAIHAGSHQLRLIYKSRRASRRPRSATFVQCRVDEGSDEVWINQLQVSDALRRQGLGRELVQGIESTARAIGMSAIAVYPLFDAVGFWESLGYLPDSNRSRVLQKRLC
jgi:GNAT superfamily N-acetyltransferase